MIDLLAWLICLVVLVVNVLVYWLAAHQLISNDAQAVLCLFGILHVWRWQKSISTRKETPHA